MGISTHDTDEVEATTDKGRAPRRRIKNAKNAYGIYDRLKENSKAEAWGRAKIQGLIDGNAPYNPSELRRLGQAWRSNVNFREAESIIDSNVGAYWELIMEVPTLIRCKIKREHRELPYTTWEEIIAEEYTTTLQEWPSFFTTYLLHVSEMLETGVSIVHWPNSYDWRYNSVLSASVLVPAKTKASLDKLKYILIRGEMDLEDLYKLTETQEDQDLAKKTGWKISEIRAALVNAFKTGSGTNDEKYQVSEWESLQMSIKNNDRSFSETDFEPLRVVHILATESDGKVSHYIIPEDYEPKDYLFKAEGRFDSMDQQVHAFFFNVRKGYFKSARGVGHRIYPHIELSNRFVNHVLDSGMVAGSLLLKPVGAIAQNEGRLMRVGPVTILPQGFEAIQSSFQPPISHLLSIRGMTQSILDKNTGVFKRDPQDIPQRDVTAEEIKYKRANETRLEKNQVNMYYVQWDSCHKEVFRRMVNPDYPTLAPGYELAKEFKRRCEERGVPKEYLNTKKCKVSATRAIGLGSQQERIAVTNEMFANRNAFDERGQANIKRDWVAARVGYDNVDRYTPLENRNMIPSAEHSHASLENNDFVEGKPVEVGVDQLHVLHLMVHFRPLIEIADIMDKNPQQVNAQQALMYFNTALPHAGMHIQYLASDPSRKGQVKAFGDMLKKLSIVHKVLEKIVEQQQQQVAKQNAEAVETLQAAQQQIQSTELQVQLAKIQKEYEIEMYRQKGIADVREAKAQHSMALKNAEFEADQARKSQGGE